MALFLVNGVASAIPATLVLFFIEDRLRAMDGAPCSWVYSDGSAGVPLWVRLIVRTGPCGPGRWGWAGALSFVGRAGVGRG